MIPSYKSNQILLPIVIVAILIVSVAGFSFALFNYVRIGNANIISVGRINFVTSQAGTINITNLVPIDSTEAGIMDDTTKVGTIEIEIIGDTDYVNGVEYLVSSKNTHITTSEGKIVPISLEVTATNLGTESTNYFEARENKNATIYKRLVGDKLVGDQKLFVGYIKKNTTNGETEGINGKLTIKAYLDVNNILISNTYNSLESETNEELNSVIQGRTVLTEDEWSSLHNSGISFQINVEAKEGIWVNE